jgi:ACS family D-galactonate transporter-like MFS transporter
MQALTSAMSASRPASDRSKGFLWFALILLVVSVCINYIDRGNLSVAGSDVGKEFGANAQQMGKLYSAFFFTYAISQVFAGWLIDRINVNWLYAAGYLIWSGATALTGVVTGYEMLFALRLVLGMAESVAYPCYSKIIAGGFPEQQRGVANSLIDAGSKAGPALGVLICGTLLSHYGWRTMFLIIGGVSMAWLIPWVFVAVNQTVETGRAFSEPAPPILEILSKRTAWGTFIGLFCYNYTWYFLITWLPSYLEKERHYTKDMLSTFGSLPFWGVAISSLCAGTLSDALIRRGASPTKVRNGFLVTGLAMATLVLPANLVQDQKISMGILIVACLSMGLASSNIWALTQRLAGRAAAGKWTGLQNAFGNLAGIVAPWLTGWTVYRTGSFFFAFVVAAGIVILGAMAYLWIVGDIEEIRWEKQVSIPAAIQG